MSLVEIPIRLQQGSGEAIELPTKFTFIVITQICVLGNFAILE